jgi:hypothetical protein
MQLAGAFAARRRLAPLIDRWGDDEDAAAAQDESEGEAARGESEGAAIGGERWSLLQRLNMRGWSEPAGWPMSARRLQKRQLQLAALRRSRRAVPGDVVLSCHRSRLAAHLGRQAACFALRGGAGA